MAVGSEEDGPVTLVLDDGKETFNFLLGEEGDESARGVPPRF